MQREGRALLLRERRALIQQRIGEERRALKLSFDDVYHSILTL